MKVISYDHFGPADAMSLAERPDPVAGKGQVVVAVHATSVNVIDSRVRDGRMGPLVSKTFPKTPGADVAGVVLAVGPGVTDFKVADEVFGAADPFKGGAFAERVVLPVGQLALKPPGITFEQAASLPIAGLAALDTIRKLGQVKAGDEVLIHGASGGVGLFAIQLAKQAGATVTAVTGTGGVTAVRGFRADTVIDYRTQDASAFSHSFDVILNASGKLPYGIGKRFLKPGGRLIEPSPTIPLVIGTKLMNPFRSRKHLPLLAFPRRADLETLALLASQGTLQTTISATYSLIDFRSAFSAMEKGGTVGKVVVLI